MKRLLIAFITLFPLCLSAQDCLPAAATKEYSTLFQQSAAEYRALCYQAFNIATMRLNEIPRKKFRKQKLAIVTDLDETILDNSYAEANMIRAGKEFDNSMWKDWVNHASATAVPGAVEFLQYASARGATIFYISNRGASQVAATLANLQMLHLPNADSAHIMLQSGGPSKETRRQTVAQQYSIIMLLGDNLNDFTAAFEGSSISERFAQTDLAHSEWGKRFIVLPNGTYGEWENALYGYPKQPMSVSEKEAARLKLLKGF